MVLDRVFWNEPNHVNAAEIKRLVSKDLERMTRDRDERLVIIDRTQLMHELAEKYIQTYPPTTKIYARVISTAYQQAQVAVSVNSVDRHVIERVKPEWKLLIVREDTGEVLEKKPSEVTYETSYVRGS